MPFPVLRTPHANHTYTHIYSFIKQIIAIHFFLDTIERKGALFHIDFAFFFSYLFVHLCRVNTHATTNIFLNAPIKTREHIALKFIWRWILDSVARYFLALVIFILSIFFWIPLGNIFSVNKCGLTRNCVIKLVVLSIWLLSVIRGNAKGTTDQNEFITIPGDYNELRTFSFSEINLSKSVRSYYQKLRIKREWKCCCADFVAFVIRKRWVWIDYLHTNPLCDYSPVFLTIWFDWKNKTNDIGIGIFQGFFCFTLVIFHKYKILFVECNKILYKLNIDDRNAIKKIKLKRSVKLIRKIDTVRPL